MKYLRAFAMAAAMFWLLASANTEELPGRGFDVAAYELSLLSADRAEDPLGWITVAGNGLNTAMARWERMAAELYVDTESMETARNNLAGWTEVDVARRFAEWLRDRFFGREAARMESIVSSAVTTANERFLYVTSDDGSILVDENGNPRYAEVDGQAPLAELGAWRESVGHAVSEATAIARASYELPVETLLSAIPDSSRALYQEAMSKAATEALDRSARELNALAYREERLFVSRRSSDVWSLRKKSDGETAGAIAASLVRDVSAACEEGLASLAIRLETASASSVDLDAAGEGWLESFREQFGRGLASWQNAEERFMVRRFEWERDTASAYQEGSSSWAEAYRLLLGQKKAWEASASVLLRNGEAAFAAASESLEASIAAARAEFDRDAARREASGAERANALVDMYLQASVAADTAKEGAEYWLSLLGSDAPGFEDENLGEWLVLQRSVPGVAATRTRYLEEAAASLVQYDEFTLRARDA
ncbi:MAG: hypothetical protein JXM71_10850, partial [Spirochaetales bacterium]|nr:hypothetical protein [Spirochaetales bacterium]